MSRLTGADAYSLMEAYNNVYAPQELTEEQVWEEVETWVNSLLEEGYDLSDYTWEEMYEEYLNEMGQPGGNRPGQQSTTRGAVTTYAQPRPNTGQPYQSRFARPMNANTPRQTGRGTGTTRPQIGSLPTNYRGAELQQTAAARASQSGTSRQGTAGGPAVGGNTPIGSSPVRTNTPPVRTNTPPVRTNTSPVRTNTPPVRTNTPPVRTNTPPARTATPPGGTTKPTAPATTTPTPAPSAPRQKDTSITDMIGRSQVRQGAAVNTGSSTSDARAISARSSVGATPKPAPSTAAAKPTPRQARLNMEMEYDTFDTVLEYLVAEGYADTEEAALVIMANMSEEWREEILEGKTDRPLGYMHSFARGIKQKKGKKDAEHGQDTEGNPTGKYTQMLKKA
jgi:hypothetical protein